MSQTPSIYSRVQEDGGWRYETVFRAGSTGRPPECAPPFYIRYTPKGSKWQQWKKLNAEKLVDAKTEAVETLDTLAAESQGLSVADTQNSSNKGKTPLRVAIDGFLQKIRKTKTHGTIIAYVHHLDEFYDFAHSHTRFVDDITPAILRGYADYLAGAGYGAVTQRNRTIVVLSLLKAYGVQKDWENIQSRKEDDKTFSLKNDLPTIEREAAVPYQADELKKLFAACTPEERLRYKFFLGTGCRDQEVVYASWNDIDFQRGLFHVRAKPEVGFTVKKHNSRSVPLPSELLKLLKERKEIPPHPRWIFVNESGVPDHNFLGKLKNIARRAELNCEQCETCKTKKTCEHFYLHRFRKTAATGWHHAHVPPRTIQAWLGHKSLEVTMQYLGVDTPESQHANINAAFASATGD